MDPLGLYRTMVRVRRLNDDAIILQRQGALTGFAPVTGLEAAQVGSALALDYTRDFSFPTYREFGAILAAGVDPVDVLAHHAGYADGGAFDSAAVHVGPINSVVGGTALHAVGWAMGAALDGSGAVALCYFGDGASSEGEIHEAMNFAGVFAAPVIFFCQNNGWAISTPTVRQVAGGSVAARAAGYGLCGEQIDGNDALAVYEATAAAVARARDGKGATVIEAMTYRVGPHTTSDDPSRYRDSKEEETWRAKDPIAQLKSWLLDCRAEAEATFDEIDAAAQVEAKDVRRRLSEYVRTSLREQAGLVFAHPPQAVSQRADAWLNEAQRV